MLYGRDAERSVIGRLLEDAGAGASGVLVVRGEPGIGKTALLDSFADQDDMLVLRGVGIESEAELPFGVLHLLLRPVLADQLKGLPDPQRQALEGAFGLALGVSADRMMVGLAVLTLLSELAEDAPVLCLIDDAQWLDRPSAEALLFAARRLGAEGVAMVFAVRDGEAPFPTPGLPELRLTGLSCEAAAALVDAREGDLASEVRRRVLAEAGGNPLALIELPTALTVSTPGPALPLTNRLQLAFHAQAGGLPEASRTLLLVAAADDTGDLGLLLRAAESMGAGVGDLPAVEEAGLLRLDGRQVTFRHPLVRSAVYQGTPLDQRLCAHRALAGALTDADQADRRAWHLASAATGPDADIAAELERTASLAAERKGYAASAAAYERAAQLAATAEVRTRLLTLAAETALESGALARAQALAERVTDPVARRGLVRVRATAAAGQGFLRQAHALQLAEATRLAERDPVGAVEVMMDALHTTWFSGEHDLATVTATQLEALRPPAGDPAWSVLRLQRWLTALAPGRSAERLPDLAEVFARAAAARAHEARDVLMICGIGLMGGLDTEAESLASGVVAAARTAGKVGVLPAALYYAAISQTFLGRHRDAATSAAEALDIAEDTGQPHWVGHAQGVLAHLSAIEGDETRCRDLARPALTDPGTGARPAGLHRARWALGLLDLGHGRVREALDHLSTLYHGPARHQLPAERSLPDLVEAAVRLGELDLATGALDRLTDLARRVPVPSIEALLHRCRALLDPDDDTFALSLRLHQRDSRPFEHARTQLLYGEWLRRGRRKTEARAQLAAALETFDLIGARAWAERAQSELEATGVVATTPRRGPGVLSLLTPQELHIVTLAADGMSNKDIAAQLFISPRTVGHHLYRAYPKLGVASRHELSDALAAHQ